MRTRLLLTAYLSLIEMIAGCSPPVTPTPTPDPTLPPANVTCNELSFYLDPAIGSRYECESVPESSDSDIPMDIFIYPAYTQLTIQDYPLADTQFPPQIRVYPVARFGELLPDVLPRQVYKLESLISGSSINSQDLPFLPPMPLTQAFFSHENVISFNNGQGVRFITQYNEIDNVISSRTIIYTFQGLTRDGRYWVALTLPISNPILPADDYISWPPEGYTHESWIQNYDSYISEITNELDAQSPQSFSPTISLLDSLVESITITEQ